MAIIILPRVLSLVYQEENAVHICRDTKRNRYVIDQTGQQPKEKDALKFLGIRVHGQGGNTLLECPGEQAFWSDDGVSVSPPKGAKLVHKLGLELKAEGERNLKIWLRLPNVLLPMHHSLHGKDDPRDGNFSWLVISLKHLFGEAVWSMGFVAGGDTRDCLWFKDAKWGETLVVGQMERAGWPLFGPPNSEEDKVPDKTLKRKFGSLPLQLAIPSPLPYPTPRTRLTSAAERILGLSAETNRENAEHPVAPLVVTWEQESSTSGAKPETVWRLTLRRVFRRTPFAADDGLRLTAEELTAEAEKPQKDRDSLSKTTLFTLSQRSRPLSESQPLWYVQASFKEPFSDNDRTPDPEYLKQLGRIFRECWTAMLGAKQAEIHESTALFALEPDLQPWVDAANASQQHKPLLSLDAYNPMPVMDVLPEKEFFRSAQRYPGEHNVHGYGRLRLEIRPPEFYGKKKSEFEAPLVWTHLRDHLGMSLSGLAKITVGKALNPTINPLGPAASDSANRKSWLVAWDLVVKKIFPTGIANQVPLRMGSLDLIPHTGSVNSQPVCSCQFYFRQNAGVSDRWDVLEPLQLHFHAIGWTSEGTGKGDSESLQVGPNAWTPQRDRGLRIPLDGIRAGETDHHEAETELLTVAGGPRVSAERPLIINVGELKPGDLLGGSWALELQEIAGSSFTRQLNMGIKKTGSSGSATSTGRTGQKAGQTSANQRAATIPTVAKQKTLYLDRTPFFVGLFELDSITQFPLEEGNEASYFSTKGVFRGWQLRSTRFDFALHLPPQGIGEAMEKGRRSDGYSDIEEGDTVEFRFPPISTLTIRGSDHERRFGPVPWNLRLTLNSLKENRLVGLPLKRAEFEMLYGLRMKIEPSEETQYLRVAELLARLGWPRATVLFTPANEEYWDAAGKNFMLPEATKSSGARHIYEEMRRAWDNLLAAVNSRLAVYEVFDDRQVDFDPKGEPAGLLLQGDSKHRGLTAELRKAARLRVSMAADQHPPGTGPDADVSSTPLSNEKNLMLLHGATLNDQLDLLKNATTPRDWWSKLIPNYDDGLAGSFAWAFESRLLYESLWSPDPNPNTSTVVEAVEATLARLYFSALGGWSAQRAAFAGGKIVVVVNVEMGRVSELRVEVIGRIGILWNKAKLVTVFRRSVLPSDQFQNQQDLHEGRPLLRKVEEYVEFLEKYRLADDSVTLRETGKLKIEAEEGRRKAGCLKASSCEEKILVDSRWGTDVYDKDGRGLGFKVPLRKPGLNKRIYGPANLLLHFHANAAGPTSEISGRIENLEDVVFWSDVRATASADTNTWAIIPLIDSFATSSNDDVNKDVAWSDAKAVKDWNDAMVWGTPPLHSSAVQCTFRVAGLTKEASLNKHLLERGAKKSEDQRPVGSILRNVTLSRGVTAMPVGVSKLEVAADKVNEAAAVLHAANEHALGFLEQVAARTQEAGELAFGWIDGIDGATAKLTAAGMTADKVSRFIDDLHPLIGGENLLNERFKELKRRIDKDLGHLAGAVDVAVLQTKWDALLTKLRTQGTATVKAELEALRSLLPTELARFEALGSDLATVLNTEFTQCRQMLLDLKQKVENWMKQGSLTTTLLCGTGKLFDAFADEEFKRMVAQVQKAVATLGVKVQNDLLTLHLEVVMRTGMARRMLRRLDAWAVRIMNGETPASLNAEVQALAASCLLDAADFATEVKKQWEAVVAAAPGHVPAKEDLNAVVAQTVDAFFVRTVAQAGTDKFDRELASALKAEVDTQVQNVVTAVQAKLTSLNALLQKAAEKHERIVEMIRQNVDDWVLGTASEALARIQFEAALTRHCSDQCAALHSLFADITGIADKQVAALQRFIEALKTDAAAVLTVFNSNANTWMGAAANLKTQAWQAIKDQVSQAAKGPVAEVVKNLNEIQQAVQGIDATEMRNKLSRLLDDHIQHLARRANRELRSIADQIHAVLGVVNGSMDKTVVTARVERLKRDWLDKISQQIDRPLLKRALENIAGTAEHARLAVERAQVLHTRIVALVNALPTALADETEQAKRALRLKLAEVRQEAEALVDQLNLPWLQGLPKRVRPETVVNELRRLLAELERVTITEVNRVWFEGRLNDARTRLTAHFTLAQTDLNDLQTAVIAARDVIPKEMLDATTGLAKKLDAALASANWWEEINKEMREFETRISTHLNDYGALLAKDLEIHLDKLLAINPTAFVNQALSNFGITNLALAADELKNRLPSLEYLERGAAELQGWMNEQRESLALMAGQVKDVLDLRRPVEEAGQAVLQTFRAFGQVPKVPALNFTDMASLQKLTTFPDAVKGYINNINARIGNVSYAFDALEQDLQKALRITPIKSMVDRLKSAGGEALEEARLRAATVETVVRNLGEKVEADARRLVENIKPSLKDLLPDFGGLKLEKLLAAAGLSDKLIEDFQRKLVTQHGVDPQTKAAFVDSRLDNLRLDDSLTIFSVGPVTLRLRNVNLAAHLRIETGLGKATRRESDGALTADWEILVGGTAVITYEQAALRNINGDTKMELDPTKVRLPSVLQSIADIMKSYSYKDDSGLQAGVINKLPTEVTGYVKFLAAIPSAGAGTSGIVNLRISLFFELALRFPRFPSMRDAGLRVSAGVGLSDREAPFIFAIWILGGCGWFTLRLDYVVPFTDGTPRLEVNVSFGLGVSASLAFDCGFASGSVYVALAVEIECTVSPAGNSLVFSIVLTIAGNLDLLGIVTVNLLLMLKIGYSSPGPMIGTGLIRVKIKICWCFTFKLERSFTKTFGGGGGGQSSRRVQDDRVPAIAAASSQERVPVSILNRQAKRTPDFAPVQAHRPSAPPPAPPPSAHRRSSRMIV
jgi:hypothetical protein